LSPAELAALAGRCESFSGAEIEQAIVAALYSAHAAKQPVSAALIAREIQNTRPLAVVMAEKVAALRAWPAPARSRPTDTANASAPACAAYGRQRRTNQTNRRWRHVVRHVGSCGLYRIRQIVAAAIAERAAQHPIAFNEFDERGMLAINVADMTACGEGGYCQQRNARTGTKKSTGWMNPES